VDGCDITMQVPFVNDLSSSHISLSFLSFLLSFFPSFFFSFFLFFFLSFFLSFLFIFIYLFSPIPIPPLLARVSGVIKRNREEIRREVEGRQEGERTQTHISSLFLSFSLSLFLSFSFSLSLFLRLLRSEREHRNVKLQIRCIRRQPRGGENKNALHTTAHCTTTPTLCVLCFSFLHF